MRIIIALMILSSATCVLQAQTNPAEFIQDIDQMSKLIEEHHVSPFWSTKKEDFKTTVSDAKREVGQKDECDESCYSELLKIIASIKDGHSGINSKSRYEVFGYLPFSVRWFGDDLYVVRTSETYKNILGSRIDKVDGVIIAKVLRILRLVVPHTNNSRFKKFAGSYLHLPGLLYGLGLTKDPLKATLTLSKEGRMFDATIMRLSPEDEKSTDFVSHSAKRKQSPIHLRQKRSNYWFDYNPDSKLLYFQFNRIANMESEGSSAFNKRMWELVDSVEVDKFVLDLRYNGGGSFPLSLKFVQGILDRPKINSRGKLFIVSGFDTFSAAIQMLSQLEMRSQAIIVGEPPGGPTGHPGDAKAFKLDRTGVGLSLSSLYHPSVFVDDQASLVGLDRVIVEEWKDRISGRDPVMDYVSGYSDSKIKPAAASDFKSYLGTYNYSLTRNLWVNDINGQLWLEISGGVRTPLYPVGKNTFQTEIVGMKVELLKDRIAVHFPNGSPIILESKARGDLSALDYIYIGELEKAEEILENIKTKNPEYIELKDHQMSFLASIVYFDLLSNSDLSASEIAKAVLNLGIKLNDGNAPFCKFSLRFY